MARTYIFNGSGNSVPAAGTANSSKVIGSSPAGANHSTLTNSVNSAVDTNNQLYQSSALQQMQFNAAEAQKNRDWQERMSNTSYQRAVEDLRKAGLNPVLSYLNGGAATTSGSSASANMANVDTSNSSGAIALMTSLISAASAENVAKIYAAASMYSSDNSLAGTKYATNNGNYMNVGAWKEAASNLVPSVKKALTTLNSKIVNRYSKNSKNSIQSKKRGL